MLERAFRIQDMLPGPVFNVELVTTARRARYYAIRFAYGMILLFFVVQTVGQWRGDGGALWQGGALSIAEMAATGRNIFATFTVFQAVSVLVLTPAIVAGVVADEKRRKTLPYLMASRLSSSEIILGKLLARLLHVSIFLAIGLPVMSLISLFGGVEPAEVVLAYAGTLTTAGFLAALSILVSTLSRRPRDAGVQVYILELAWLFGPSLVAHAVPSLGGRWLDVYEWIAYVNNPLRWSSPYAILEALSTGGSSVGEAVVGMAALQTAFAAVLVLLAILVLRPVMRREGQGVGRLGGLAAARRQLRLLRRPAIGDDAMLWKECHVARAGGLLRFIVNFVFLVVAAALAYTTFWYAAPAFAELFNHGYSSDEAYGERRSFNFYLRLVCTLVYITWSLGVASLAAASVSGEREEDTWTSLITTPLSGEEILRAKIVGAIWGALPVGTLLVVLWLLGLVSGAVHPLGFAAVALETTAFVWFAAALGVTFSLGARSSARAQAATMAVLVTVNGLYLLCCIPLRPGGTLFWAAGVTPLIEGISLLSYDQIAWIYANPARSDESDAITTCILAVLLYGAAALILTTKAFISFDDKIDRPRRGWRPPASAILKPPSAARDDDEGSDAY
jgi:ABC-type transport system involved in multi-copper enzyme maturation permease subunit